VCGWLYFYGSDLPVRLGRIPTDVINNLDIPTKTKPSISLKYRVQTLFFYAQPKLVAGLDKTSKMCYIILLI